MVGVSEGVYIRALARINSGSTERETKRKGRKEGRCLLPILKNCPTFSAVPLIFDTY